MNKSVGMMMRNKAKELASLDPLLITLQRRPTSGYYDSSNEEVDFGEFANPCDKEVECSDNQTIGETMNTN